ncbi:MAG: hypothetical protein JWO22_3449 [Frankiales bacterium]|nr:hypothetical protein [Frankiales bacterium]
MLYLPVADLPALEADPDVAALWFADLDPVDIGHAWHGLHVLLNGSAWGGSPPLYDAVLGGTPVGDPTSYEPIRFVAPADVKAVAAALPPAPELISRFTHAKMKQVEAYPEQRWSEPNVLTAFLLPAYETLRSVFETAAAHGQALLITLDRE